MRIWPKSCLHDHHCIKRYSYGMRVNRHFREAFRVKPDSKGRITLGRLAREVSSYVVRVDSDGRVLLEPYAEATIRARERWLFESKTARNRVLRGLANDTSGRVRSLGHFSRQDAGRNA